MATAAPSARNFERNGFAVLREFLSKRETARSKMLVESVRRSPKESTCARPHNTLIALRWNDPIVELLLTPMYRLRVLSGAVGGDDLKWISAYISIKEPRSLSLWWHQDWWCWDHRVSYQREASQVAILCYLSDTDVNNGALRVLPGSHLRSAPIHALLPEAHGAAAADVGAENVAMADIPGQITLKLKAGDAAVIDYRLLHGTHGNASSLRRDCILLSFVPSWRRLPDDIRAHLIQHPAQPSEEELPQMSMLTSRIVPTFEGVRRSLVLNRNAPARFNTGGERDSRPSHKEII